MTLAKSADQEKLMSPAMQTKAIADTIINNINTTFPLAVGSKTLTVSNVKISDIDKIDPDNYYEIAKAKAHDKTLGVSIYGDLILKDGDKIVDKKRMKLATAPAMAGDGTFIIGGSQFSVDKQLRLRPGIYSRIKQNGEIEAHINPDGFKNLKLAVDPATQKLTVNVNQANINAIPVLRILGISDKEIKDTFGTDVYDANIKHIKNKNDDEIKRFFKSVKPNAVIPETHQEISNFLATELKEAKLDPQVTQITMGHPFAHLDGRALLRGFEKVVNVSKGIEQPDDRDSLTFKTIHSVEDFVHERLKKNKRSIQFSIENKMRKHDKLDNIINSGQINQHVFSFFNSAALSEIPSQINPLSIINSAFKTTITGEGGIENAESIMAESQALHPSHMGYLDPINTPESKKIGVTLNLAVGVTKKGNTLYTQLKNVKTGKLEDVSPLEAYHHYLALPDQELKGQVTAIHHGKQIEVDAKQITHQLPSTHAAFTMASQVLPGINHNSGNRAGMSSRHINQAISLKHREAPLVQTLSPLEQAKGQTSEQYFGKNHKISIHAQEDGKIENITNSHLIFKGDSGKIYEHPLFTNFDLQNKSYLHHEIDHLTPGMQFKKGSLIADSNFTKDGTLALGTNLRVAYMPWKGLNFEDGIVISETAAKKLTSNHLYQDHIEKNDSDIIVNKRKFVTMYPSIYTKAQLNKIGENGLAKEGAVLNPGDPYALVLHKTQGTQEDLMLNRLHKSLVQPYKDMSKTWAQLTPGKVTKSIFNNNNVKIHTQYEAPAIVGDKLALRHGNKGVITSIIPDSEIPTTKDGKATEVLISPLSVITRMSIGQMLENSASKIAEKVGKPYVIENFSKDNQLEKINKDLVKHGLSDTEELIDPKTKKSYGQVLVGKPFVEKLFKTAKANVSARDMGTYDIDNKPVKGGVDGSKAIDQLTLYGLLSHGNRNIINEVSTIKGDGNSQFWQNLQNGLPTSKPGVPFAYQKFEAMLNAAGVNVRQNGSQKILTPLTDKQTLELTGNNEVKNFSMLDHNLLPIKGGLFDIQITGGSNGQKWSKMTLAHPLVNPLFESAVKTLLDMKDSEFRTILNEEKGHDKIKGMLSSIDVRDKITSLSNSLASAPKTKKDKIVKQIKLLKSLDYLKMTPDEAYTTSVVPIIPPTFRPVFEIPGGHIQIHSLNSLYRDLGLVNNTIKDLGATPELTSSLYQALGAVQGINTPISKQNELKGVKGAVKIITGAGSPKYGYFQNKVLRKQQDLSGRATAVLNNNLGMDQIAIPEKIAKTIYKPFAMKELIRNGYSYKDAEQHLEDFSPIGQKAVQAAMSDRPVLMNRAPSLHKYSIMAFQPTLTKGLSIETPGVIVKPFGLDYDGDTVVLHVPATEKARKESFNMLPSKNLYSASTRKLNYLPDQEAILGLYLLSQSKDGLKQINALLPNDITHLTTESKKSAIENILTQLADKHPEKYNDTVTKLKELGDNHATDVGFSLSLKDLPDHSKLVKKQYANAMALMGSKSLKDEHKLTALYAADKAIKAQALDDKTNNFVTMAASGSRGSAEQVKQILYAPGLLIDHNGDTIMRPVLTNFAQGMPFADYWTTLYSARKGSLDAQLMTAKPGALNKEIVNTTLNLVVSQHDCKTKHGLPMKTEDSNIIGRYLIDGTLITKDNINKIRKNATVIVRSPATCESSHGVCQKCYGIDEYHALPKIGDNIGIKAAQSISEPLTQSALKTKHTGGTVSGGGGVFGGFEVIANFLQAPETFKNRATMASETGTITHISPGSAGGWHVKVDDQEHFVNAKSGELLVKKGDKVKKGDLLNFGIPHPKDAINLLGEIDGIAKITDTLHKVYTDTNLHVDRRNIESVVRGMTGFGIIKDEGTHQHFVQGDTVPLSSIYEWNKNAHKVQTINLHDSYGMVLNKKTGVHEAGTRIDSNTIKDLSKTHKQVEVKQLPIQYNRTVIGVQQAPLHTNDWMSRLGYRYLKRGLQDGASYGYSSDVHGYAPIPAFVTGNIGDSDAEGRY